jgi:hypothetical protein
LIAELNSNPLPLNTTKEAFLELLVSLPRPVCIGFRLQRQRNTSDASSIRPDGRSAAKEGEASAENHIQASPASSGGWKLQSWNKLPGEEAASRSPAVGLSQRHENSAFTAGGESSFVSDMTASSAGDT